jgi:hypothetical protein
MVTMVTATGVPRVRRYRLDSGTGLTPAQRAERGKTARAAAPRGSHAVFEAPAGRPDPVALLEEQAASRRFCGASTHANQGQRVVAGQRLIQAAGDIFLGWHRIGAGLDGQPHDFYARQFRDWKLSLPIETMVPRGMRLYGELCGWTLARAHARSGDRIAIAAYLGSSDVFDQAITEFAAAYADQNERDYQALRQAAASGRITAEHGT